MDSGSTQGEEKSRGHQPFVPCSLLLLTYEYSVGRPAESLMGVEGSIETCLSQRIDEVVAKLVEDEEIILLSPVLPMEGLGEKVFDLVVLVQTGSRSASSFFQDRHCEDEESLLLQHPVDFREAPSEIGHMFQYVTHQDKVKKTVRIGETHQILRGDGRVFRTIFRIVETGELHQVFMKSQTVVDLGHVKGLPEVSLIVGDQILEEAILSSVITVQGFHDGAGIVTDPGRGTTVNARVSLPVVEELQMPLCQFPICGQRSANDFPLLDLEHIAAYGTMSCLVREVSEVLLDEGKEVS